MFKHENYLTLKEDFDKDNIHYIWKFPNNYGASVVRREDSYGFHQGLFELAVIKYNEKGKWDIDYDTHITNDVIGYLNEQSVNSLLDEIIKLDIKVEESGIDD